MHPLGKYSWTDSLTMSVESSVRAALKVKLPLYSKSRAAEPPVHPFPVLLRSSLAVTHDWVTFHVPTMLPPHGDTVGQVAPPVPV
jgi:hypothetical protein